jgi:hypothetical protein
MKTVKLSSLNIGDRFYFEHEGQGMPRSVVQKGTMDVYAPLANGESGTEHDVFHNSALVVKLS